MKARSYFTTASLLTTSFVISMSPSSAADRFKADNSNNLNLGSSWTGGTAPGVNDTAIWNSTVTGANTVSLGTTSPLWGSLRIVNPGGDVTINGNGNATQTLRLNGLGGVGIDMSNATQNLTINPRVNVRESQSWNVADGRTLTVNAVNTNGNATETLTVTGAGNTAINGVVSTDLILSKTGNGTLTLSGSNTYTGTTSVTGGTLVINGSQTTARGNITVGSGATLSGSGTAGADLTTIQSGGTLKAGTAGADLVFNNSGAITSDLAFGAGSIFDWDISSTGTFSITDVEGTVTGSGATFKIGLSDFSNAFWDTDQSWSIADIFSPGSGSTSLTSIFSTLMTNQTASGGGRGFSFNTGAGTLNWSAVPEPTSALAGILLGVGLLRRRRR